MSEISLAEIRTTSTGCLCLGIVPELERIVIIAIHVLLRVSLVISMSTPRQSTYESVADPYVQRMRIICGPNSLYLLLRTWDVVADYSELEKTMPLSEGGVSLLTLKKTAAIYGLPTRVRRCTIDSLSRMNLPAIAHLKSDLHVASANNHYVVMERVAEGKVAFIDGTTGQREVVTLGKFSTKWSGYVLEPTPNELPWFPVLIVLVMSSANIYAIVTILRVFQCCAPLLCVCLSVACVSGARGATVQTSPTASTSETVWRSARNDAVNVVDLYLRVVAHPTPREQVVSAFDAPGQHATLLNLKRVFGKLGWPMRVVKTSPMQLSSYAQPVIVHMLNEEEQEGGYCLLIRAMDSKYSLINGGTVVLDEMTGDEFRRRWSGYVLIPDNAPSSWQLGLIGILAMSELCLLVHTIQWSRRLMVLQFQ